MKKQLLFALVAGLFTTGLIFTHISMTKNGIINIASLKNISLMAKASAEVGNGTICYYDSIIMIGHAYIDCTNCTTKYDEKGINESISTCQ